MEESFAQLEAQFTEVHQRVLCAERVAANTCIAKLFKEWNAEKERKDEYLKSQGGASV